MTDYSSMFPAEDEAPNYAALFPAEGEASSTTPQAAPPVGPLGTGSISDRSLMDFLSLGQGIKNFGIGMAGLPGDAEVAGNWVANKLGLPQPDSNRLFPSSDEVGATVDKTFPDFKNPFPEGSAIQTAGEWAPALFGGEGSLARKAASRIFAPMAGSEAGGEVAKRIDPSLEGAGKVIGGLGGAVSGHVGNILTGGSGIQGSADYKALKSAAYAKADAAGGVVSAPSFENGIDAVTKAADAAGINDTGLHPDAYSMYQTFDKLRGTTPTVTKVDQLRQQLSDVAGKTNDQGNPSSEARVGIDMKDALDNWWGKLKNSDMIGLNPGADMATANAARQEGRYWARKEFQANTVEKQLAIAEAQAGKSDNANALGAGIRNRFSILGNSDEIKNWTPAQKQAVKDAGKLGLGGAGVKMLSTLTGTLGTLLAEHEGGLKASVPVWLAGRATGLLGNALALSKVQNVARAIAGQPPNTSGLLGPLIANSATLPYRVNQPGQTSSQ